MKKMNHLSKIFTMLVIGLWFTNAISQTITPTVMPSFRANNHFQIAPRIGYDFPTYDNNTPYIDYKGGLMGGISFDYYWKWFGLGVDFDYIKNKPQSIYPTNNVVNATGTLLTSFSLTEKNITRMFYGIGPDLRYQSNTGRFQAELNTRAGMGSIKGGRTELRETTTLANQLLNFHTGYDANVFSTKLQVRLSYMLSQRFGVNLGAYYLRHFNVPELKDATLGMSTGYQPFITSQGETIIEGNFVQRTEPCNCDISSVGVFAGVVLKLIPKEKVCVEEKKKDDPCCGTCPVYGLAITARDKYTKEVLADTDIAVKNNKGEIVRTGKTNSFGVVVFEKILKDDYTISGLLNNVALVDGFVKKDELICDKVLQKEIIYGDRNFIIKGRAFECNSTNPIAGINVTLENKDLAVKKSTMTDAQGNFVLQLPETGTYDLYGRKENYFSQIEKVSSSDYNRDKNLFVKLEMCAEKADCGKGLGLKNILFDLDKYEIKEVAKPELNRLVRFMQDNPSVKVEVGSHTDCRSSATYNQKLSQNRANASVDYIVSQGIDRSRITGKGYGESVLLNECADGVNCTEAQHSINRRTEMKVICPPKN